jgi:hypothetical protein
MVKTSARNYIVRTNLGPTLCSEKRSGVGKSAFEGNGEQTSEPASDTSARERCQVSKYPTTALHGGRTMKIAPASCPSSVGVRRYFGMSAARRLKGCRVKAVSGQKQIGAVTSMTRRVPHFSMANFGGVARTKGGEDGSLWMLDEALGSDPQVNVLPDSVLLFFFFFSFFFLFLFRWAAMAVLPGCPQGVCHICQLADFTEGMHALGLSRPKIVGAFAWLAFGFQCVDIFRELVVPFSYIPTSRSTAESGAVVGLVRWRREVLTSGQLAHSPQSTS